MRSFRPLSLALGVAVLPALASEAPRLSVVVTFSPVKASATDCLCVAEIRDLAADRLLASPRIRLRKGESGRAEIGDERDRLSFEVAMNAAGTSGTYTVTYSQGGQVLAAQKGSIALQ
ncbi:MAG: hypothetical protein U0P46_10280 [Holophagaceae bacterium]